MRLHTIDAGKFKLDGGAMFGVVPRILWEKLNPPDDNNLCTWALRCLFIEKGDRRILIDTGIGDKQDERFMSHFHPHGAQTLAGSLERLGVSVGDITDVFLTHLHFDHCGGALRRGPDDSIVPAFPNATYWSNRSHYDWAFDPNPREKASFLKENFVPLQEHGVLKYVEEIPDVNWLADIDIFFAYGHTEAMMLPRIRLADRTVVFCADLLPSSMHVRMPYVMSYDVRPLQTLKEKQAFFDEAIDGNYILFLEHDPVTECIRIGRDERGRVAVSERGTLAEMLA
ncbi:MAG: MBL fold metallo-hydrolase [Saprospiraceae bacterium]|nr:MBL fold metallo-hydrolase [Saprospiraceae bacterium]